MEATREQNAKEVLDQVNSLIIEGSNYKYNINTVYEKLNIFDWWNDNLSMSQLKQMRKFLEVAIELGYTGYVCFKVGAKHCAHGMWAYKVDSEDGHSPQANGCLYRGFRNGNYNEWDAELVSGDWLHDLVDEDTFTLKQVKNMLASCGEGR